MSAWIDVKERLPEERQKVRGQIVYSQKERILRLSVPNQETGCWDWNGSTRNGYGRLIVGSRTDKTRRSVSAHRLSYEVFIGPVPDGYEVCHKCDNPRCVNPDHLFAGTRQDNIDDRERKSRNRLAHLKGEDHPNSKLTAGILVSLRRQYDGKRGTIPRMAKEAGVSRRAMHDAIHRKTWAWLEDAPPQFDEEAHPNPEKEEG